MRRESALQEPPFRFYQLHAPIREINLYLRGLLLRQIGRPTFHLLPIPRV